MEKLGSSKSMVECLIGMSDDIPINHKGIRCPKGHHICPTCSKGYIKFILDHPQSEIPAKGRVKTGRAEIDYKEIVRYMTGDIELDYNIYIGKNDVPKRQKTVCGPSGCEYFEFWNNNSEKHLFYCKNEDCMKGTCLVCLKEFKYPKDKKKLTLNEI